MSRAATGKRSPLKDTPLPEPGDSLQFMLLELIVKIVAWTLFPILLWGLAVGEWWDQVFKSPPAPWHATFLAVIGTGICVWQVRRLWGGFRRIKLGIDGERAIGQRIENLRVDGYSVFHDLCEEEWNVDHVLVGPGGVFAIETKTVSKPNDRNAVITYDGTRVLIDGHEPERDPLVQAKAVARHVRKIIREQTGQEIAVQAVVLYPGWFVKCNVPHPEVCVQNDVYFVGGMGFRSQVLDETTIELVVAGLERYQRGNR